MTEHVNGYAGLLQYVTAHVRQSRAPFLIGIAGTPASGKSTLARRLVADYQSMGLSARFCPMDGFHLTNAQLDGAGMRSVKGRRDTFDSLAFAAAVESLGTGTAYWWPKYCRRRHEPVPEGIHIDGTEAVYVIEGNYLLTDEEPWCTAAERYNLRVFVDARDDVLRRRLLRRHLRGGSPVHVALNKITNTDIPNARAIRTGRIYEDIQISGASRA